MDHTLRILILLLLVNLISAAAPPESPPTVSCSDKLVSFSSCLSYVAESPNNSTGSPSPQCCDDVSASFGNNSAICHCYFISRPGILGFPLNSARVMSLTSVCAPNFENAHANFSLQTLCSGPTALPPLHSITGPGSPPPPTMVLPQDPPSGSSLPPEPAAELPTDQPSLSTAPAGITPSAAERLDKLGWTLLTLLVHIFTCSRITCTLSIV